jgi:hypothetical protein
LVHFRQELETLADTGDVPPEQIRDTLEALEGDIREKAIAVAMFCRNLEADAGAIREAGKAMLARADRVQRRAENVQAYLLFQLQAAEISKIECPWFKIAVRKNPPAVVIDDETLIEDRFKVAPEPPAPRIDRKAIADELKAGGEVLGAHLAQGERLEIKE